MDILIRYWAVSCVAIFVVGEKVVYLVLWYIMVLTSMKVSHTLNLMMKC